MSDASDDNVEHSDRDEEVKGPMQEYLESLDQQAPQDQEEEGEKELSNDEVEPPRTASSPESLPDSVDIGPCPDGVSDSDSEPEPDLPEIRALFASATQQSSAQSSKPKSQKSGTLKGKAATAEAKEDDTMDIDEREQSKSPAKASSSNRTGTKRDISVLSPAKKGSSGTVKSEGPDASTAANGGEEDGTNQDEEEDQPGPSKKPRLTTGKRPKARKRDSDFWHLDGSVIIQVQNTMFRLHKSFLIRKSRYFADLLDSNGETEILDKCPVYSVEEDLRADDFRNLLKALDDGMYVSLFIPFIRPTDLIRFRMYTRAPKFDELSSVLRAATILDFTDLKRWAISAFESTFPPELSAFTPSARPNAKETVVLSRECDVPNVLKAAFYDLLRTDGMGLGLPEDCAETGEDDEDEDERVQLSRADTLRVIAAREKLTSEWVSIISNPISRKCNRPEEECSGVQIYDDLFEWNERVHKDNWASDHMYDPIGGLEALIAMKWEEAYCDDCCRAKRNVWKSRREKMWDLLDVHLQLQLMEGAE
jgi:hypothetical protein